jgi:peptidoglycan/xylan/chitin deacetylase (PgdA/CDA1 family)
MFTFRKATLLFFIILFAMNILQMFVCGNGLLTGYFCDHPRVFTIILIILFMGISVAMAFVIRSGYHYPAFCRAKTGDKICALTFDDGPDPNHTGRILDILEREKIPAAFFCIGRKIDGNESLLLRIDRQDCLIGNHSWSHHHLFDFFSPGRIRKELLRTAGEIRRVTGKSPLLFRPPYGVLNPMVTRAIRPLPWHVIGWNIRSYDTILSEPRKVVRRIVRKLKPGSVILLHDTRQDIPAILEILIPLMKQEGFRIVPLDKLFNIRAYA